MGIPEAQRRETPDQGRSELRAEAQARVFSTEVGVQVRALGWQSPCGNWGRSRSTNSAGRGIEPTWDAGLLAALVSPALPPGGDEAPGHTCACRDTVRLSLDSLDTSPSLMEAPFCALSPSPLKSGPVRASRCSIGKTLGSRSLL